MASIYAKGLKTLVVCMALSLVLGAIAVSVQAQGNTMDEPVMSNGREAEILAESAKKVKGAEPYEGIGDLADEEAVLDALSSEGVSGFATEADAEAMQELEPVGMGIMESIIGFDSRLRVYPTKYPARAIALITFTGGRCSGWMINQNTVATAGHCVHTGRGGTWRPVASFRVYPGYYGTGSPYCTAKWLGTVYGWTSSSNPQYDYGVVKLNCTIGNSTGWFGFWWQSASLTGLNSVISGYPGDKPINEQWFSVDQVRTTNTNQISYYNDTYGGQSGSPVYQDRPPGSAYCSNGACAYAIHTYGGSINSGTRITSSVFNNLINWRNAP